MTGVEGLSTALHETRERTLALVAPLSDAELERQHTPLLSPLVWDLAHIAAYEDLWAVHRVAGLPLLRPDLAELYDAFETPRAARGSLPLLGRAGALDYLEEVRARTLSVLGDGHGDGTIHEMVLRHEQQHTETMLQALELARLEDYAPAIRVALPAGGAASDPLDMVEVPAGPCVVGAAPDGFAYDNERPRHAVEVPAFRIGRRPVANAAWLAFAQDGGYRRREWWSDAGWAWRTEHAIERPGGWSDDGREWRITGWEAIEPAKPVSHVSWYEADAFARSLGARLPSEREWEKAAVWDEGAGAPRPYPWGAAPVAPERATVDQLTFGPAHAGALPAGAAPSGAEQLIGELWEWTSSDFEGYPGFVAHPYREYSEVFFGPRYKVLRGGSWATAARVATPTFRNWDLPQRRQIFAGVRLARDAG
jgi:iron(II)-dependent oxidoreductase